MARKYPEGERDFARISGVGEKKLREFGGSFSRRDRRAFADERPPDFCRRFLHRAAALPPASRRSLGDSARETLRRFRSGQSIGQIASERGVTTGTIVSHIAEGIEHGEPMALERIFDGEEQKQIAAAFDRNGFGNLTAVFESLGGAVDYGRLRIYRAARGGSFAGR